jgi:hypothetical protein
MQPSRITFRYAGPVHVIVINVLARWYTVDGWGGGAGGGINFCYRVISSPGGNTKGLPSRASMQTDRSAWCRFWEIFSQFLSFGPAWMAAFHL